MNRVHPLVEYARRMFEAAHSEAEEHRKILEETQMDDLPAYERRVVEALAEGGFREERLSAQLKAALERLAELDQLARISSPEVLMDSVEGVLDDPNFTKRLETPAMREEALIEALLGGR